MIAGTKGPWHFPPWSQLAGFSHLLNLTAVTAAGRSRRRSAGPAPTTAVLVACVRRARHARRPPPPPRCHLAGAIGAAYVHAISRVRD